MSVGNGTEGQEQGVEEGLSQDALDILAALHASLVNFHLYPPSSDIVGGSVQKALQALREAMDKWGTITFSDVEGKLLINDYRPGEREQARPNVTAFLKDLSLWDIRSITFTPEMEDDDFRSFMETFSRKRTDKTISDSLQSLLQQAGVRGIKVDEKIYVSLSKDQELPMGQAGAGRTADQPEDMLKDEIFIRYLTGKIKLPEVDEEEVSLTLKDPARINRAFYAVLEQAESSAEPGVDVNRARIIRETVDRMYGLLGGIEDEELRGVLDGEMVNILSALDPGVLVDVLVEEKPEALQDEQLRREVVHGVEGENILALTDKVIEKYRNLIEQREAMPEEDFVDISAVLNELLDELYEESEVSFHPAITEKLRLSGLLDYLMSNHPEAGEEVDAYGAITEIRSSGSLRVLEGRSDRQIALIVRKLLQLGEEERAHQILNVAARNLAAPSPGDRLRAVAVLEEIYDRLEQAGLQEAVLDKLPRLTAALKEEEDNRALEAMSRLAVKVANRLFVERQLQRFYQLTSAMLEIVEAGDWRGAVVQPTLLGLHRRDVGRPLIGLLFDEKEENREFAARLLVHMDNQAFLQNLLVEIKEDKPRPIHPQLARVVSSVGPEVIKGLAEELDRDNLEDIYLRILALLEMVGGNEAVNAVKRLTYNPIPTIRARAFRTLAKVGEGDHTLLPLFIEALRDEEVEVRRSAVRGLGGIYDERSVNTLVDIVQGRGPHGVKEDYKVEEAACLALTRLGAEKGAAAMLDLLKKKMITVRRRPVHPVVKAACCYGLSQLGGKEAVGVVRGLLEDDDPVVRNEATKAMRVFRQRGLA
jgi:HEAT repeat protein